jgi:hypothetical protein
MIALSNQASVPKRGRSVVDSPRPAQDNKALELLHYVIRYYKVMFVQGSAFKVIYSQ